MVTNPSEILALTNEAAVLVHRGMVQYANACACGILGPDCVGRTVRDLFGADIAGTQATSFISGLRLGKKQYVLRVSTVDDRQVYFLSPQDVGVEYMSDAFLFALRSSLSGFSLAAEQMRDLAEANGGAMDPCLSVMTHSYYKITRLIRNISLVRDSALGTVTHDSRIFDLAELCRSLVETVMTLLPDENIVFGFRSSMPVYGDPSLVEALLANLISNCITHARQRSRIMLNLVDSGDSVILSVSDDGCGIPPEHLNKVFGRYRYVFGLSDMGSGSGFGLSAALAAAECHGGTLLLESRPSGGTSVRASLKKGSSDTLHLARTDFAGDMEGILTGLADCLPDACYCAKYLG